MADFPERRAWIPPDDKDRERLLLATARTVAALLAIDDRGELTEERRLAYKAVMDEALRPFGPELPVNQEKRT